MRTFAVLTTVGCLGIGAWLAWALIVVAPVSERDGNRIWIAIAIIAVVSAVLTGGLFWASSSARWLPLVVAVSAAVDLAVGGWLVAVMIVATGPVEEYVLLIGVWLVLHGIASLAMARRARSGPVASTTG